MSSKDSRDYGKDYLVLIIPKIIYITLAFKKCDFTIIYYRKLAQSVDSFWDPL